jgi:hypothetical protein
MTGHVLKIPGNFLQQIWRAGLLKIFILRDTSAIPRLPQQGSYG